MSSSSSKKKCVSKKHKKQEGTLPPPATVDTVCQEFDKMLDERIKTFQDQIKANFKAYAQGLNVENCESKLTKTILENDVLYFFSREMIDTSNKITKPLIKAQKTKRREEFAERKSKIHKSVASASSFVIEKNENCLKLVPKDQKEDGPPLILSGDAITYIGSFLPFENLLSLRLVCKVFAEKSSKSMLDVFTNKIKNIRIDYSSPIYVGDVENLGALGCLWFLIRNYQKQI